jgi:hypothetical protein
MMPDHEFYPPIAVLLDMPHRTPPSTTWRFFHKGDGPSLSQLIN